ncbi:MAG: transketolase [Bacteroidales bacterium]|jgi:transketolase|nr:transketolase [Bacteroidales bacterium]NMD03206.1 transketolase [Bacteroidales bacterium]HOU01854.1 transketolase [Bacteroidales bacterium]HQK67915.1 transketolase [Bacteroidales bacterium]
MDKNELLKLESTALKIRRNILRLIKAGEAGHVGGALSSVEILTALYFNVLNVDPLNPKWPLRDRFVLSAGHKCLVLYAALAEKGFFDESVLDTYGDLDSHIPGHPNMQKLPGVETNTGALGHGLSIAGGMALGLRMDKSPAKVYVLMGDGELAEGSNWEAASAASMHKLDNMLVFVDRNQLQISGRTVDVMSYEPLDERWRSFGWSVRVINGHDLEAIINNARSIPFEKGKPSLIIADTIKSKGLSFAEKKVNYHYWKATPEEMKLAEHDLDMIEKELKEKIERSAGK